MKDPDELSRGLLSKAQQARSSALAVLEFVLDRLPDDIRKAAG
jgi:hypothetical protein